MVDNMLSREVALLWQDATLPRQGQLRLIDLATIPKAERSDLLTLPPEPSSTVTPLIHSIFPCFLLPHSSTFPMTLTTSPTHISLLGYSTTGARLGTPASTAALAKASCFNLLSLAVANTLEAVIGPR